MQSMVRAEAMRRKGIAMTDREMLELAAIGRRGIAL